jgi:hypothetical protein
VTLTGKLGQHLEREDFDKDRTERRDLIHVLQDGMYLIIEQKQTRFVRRASPENGGGAGLRLRKMLL